MRTRPHIMLRSIMGAAFGFVITLALVDPCAGQQNVTAPSGAAVGRDVNHSTINIYNNPEPSHSSGRSIAPNISGIWRDYFGVVYQVDHKGDGFTFTAAGVSCRGSFRSQGQGTISGNILTSHYISHYSSGIGSTGTCSATIDGSRITGDCTDTVCGSFSVTSYHR